MRKLALTLSASFATLVVSVVPRSGLAQTCSSVADVNACQNQQNSNNYTSPTSNWYAGVFGAFTGDAGNGDPGVTSAGVIGFTDQDNSYGVEGYNSPGIGVYGYTSSGEAGVYGTTAYTYGVEGIATNTGGVGIYGTASDGYAIEGYSATSAVVGETTTTSGESGIAGICLTSAASCNGVYGKSNATSSQGGAGIYGVNTSSGIGVYGVTNGGPTGTTGTYAIYGAAATSTSNYAGYFSGNVKITGTLTCGVSCNSDERLKKRIASLPSSEALDRLLRLRGVTFEWMDPAGHENHTGTQTGVIAQDVEKVEPQWVRDDTETGVKNVEPDARTMVALTVEGFRALKTENDALKARVDALEAGRPVHAGFDLGMTPANLVMTGFTGLAAFFFARRKKEAE